MNNDTVACKPSVLANAEDTMEASRQRKRPNGPIAIEKETNEGTLSGFGRGPREPELAGHPVHSFDTLLVQASPLGAVDA